MTKAGEAKIEVLEKQYRNKLQKLSQEELTKTRRFRFRIFKDDYNRAKEVAKTLGIRPYEIWQAFVVSGIGYARPEIIKFIHENIGPWKEYREKERKTKNSNSPAPEPMGELIFIDHFIYPKEFIIFKKAVVELGYPQEHMLQCLTRAFADQNPTIIEWVKTIQKSDVIRRKKKIAALSQDEYIKLLPMDIATTLLEQFTQKYDDRKFGGLHQKEVEELVERQKQKQKLEEELDEVLNAKLRSVSRTKNTIEIDKIIDESHHGYDDDEESE